MEESLVKIRHERSKKDFPRLKLEEDEYIEFAFDRAKICLMMIILSVSSAVILILLGFLLTLLAQPKLDEVGKNFVFIILSALLASALIIGIIAISIYHGNKLFITNKRVIQYIMESPVSSSTNIIDLQSVEDASFHQKGIMAMLFHYGVLRLATVGDETTYTFKYSDITTEELEGVTKLITNAKKPRRHKKTIVELDPELEEAADAATDAATTTEQVVDTADAITTKPSAPAGN